jgi:hypothetical protein
VSKPGYKFKNDHYKEFRGGYSRILNISCAKCSKHICFHQKDGPGILKRMYLDRIIDTYKTENKQFICPGCNQILGIKFIYEK